MTSRIQEALDALREYRDLEGMDKSVYDLLSEVLENALKDEWADISTAPKDGTGILLKQTTGHFQQTFYAYWREDPEGWYDDGGHWFIDDGKNEHPQRGHEPTHWRLVPTFTSPKE